MGKIGIMGGTFDPIHYGHLVAAETARVEFNLDEVIFVPSGQPPHKRNRAITDREHRYQMTKLAISSNPYFDISRVEIDHEGYSYANDTVDHFYRLYGDETDLWFITGADAIKEILNWYKAEELIQKCRFMAVTRPGYDGAIPAGLSSRVVRLTIPSLAISSSGIRTAVENGKSIRYLLPDNVEAYIREHHLYRHHGGDER